MSLLKVGSCDNSFLKDVIFGLQSLKITPFGVTTTTPHFQAERDVVAH